MLDAILRDDPSGRVACETLVKTGVVIVAGEVTTSAWIDLEKLVRETVLDIGYNHSDMGFDGASCGVINIIGKQSPDIAMGVDRSDKRKQGAGDQGLMFGYATERDRSADAGADHPRPPAGQAAGRSAHAAASCRGCGRTPRAR